MEEKYRHKTAILYLAAKWHIWSYTEKPRQVCYMRKKEQEGQREKKRKEEGQDSICFVCCFTKLYNGDYIIQLFEIAVHSSVQALWVELLC